MRFLIIGVVLAVAFTLYTLVDAAMTDASHARGVTKPVWVVLTIVLPVLGGILWLTVGKGREPEEVLAADDDPVFSGMTRRQFDKHIEDLEEQLKALDDEVYPGERPGSRNVTGSASEPAADDHPDETGDAPDAGLGRS